MRYNKVQEYRTNNVQQTSVSSLTCPEHWLLIIMRLWIAEIFEPGRWHADWKNGFRAAGLGQESFQAFNTLANALLKNTHRPMKFHSPDCNNLCHDEKLFLHMICLLQLKQWEKANRILDYWLPATAACIAFSAAKEIANVLLTRGMPIPLRAIWKNPNEEENDPLSSRSYHGQVTYLH